MGNSALRIIDRLDVAPRFTLADAAQSYFYQSEQIPTLVRTGMRKGAAATIALTAGVNLYAARRGRG